MLWNHYLPIVGIVRHEFKTGFLTFKNRQFSVKGALIPFRNSFENGTWSLFVTH